MDKQNIVHNNTVNIIRHNPKIIGLDGIILATSEVNFFNTATGKGLYHQTDSLCFDPATKKLYNIEYKCGNKHKDKAIKQLTDERPMLEYCFPQYEIINLYIHEDFQKEEIR